MDWSYSNKFHRSIIFSNIVLNGVFKYDSIFQLLPGKEEWPQLKQGYGNKPIILEFDYSKYSNFELINKKSNSNKDTEDLQEKFRYCDHKKETLALLTLVTNCNFYEGEKYSLNNSILGEDFFNETFLDTKNIPLVNQNNDYKNQKQNLLGDSVIFPTDNGLFFDSYFSMKGETLNRARMSIMLYFNSIDILKYSPSMCYVSLISAIENLVDYEGLLSEIKYETCKCCNQTMYKVSRRFKDFMMTYCGDSSKGFKKYLNGVYTKRSHVAHLGQLFYNDYANTELDQKGIDEILTLKKVTRIALYNWIISKKNYIESQLIHKE